MTQKVKQSFWSDFRTGLTGFSASEQDIPSLESAIYTLDVQGATGAYQHLNGRFTLRRPDDEVHQTWVTDGVNGFYLMNSIWGWRLQQGEGPDFSSGWEQGPTGTYTLRGLGNAEGQTLTAVVSE
jgi:hypothetical protein